MTQPVHYNVDIGKLYLLHASILSNNNGEWK